MAAIAPTRWRNRTGGFSPHQASLGHFDSATIVRDGDEGVGLDGEVRDHGERVRGLHHEARGCRVKVGGEHGSNTRMIGV